MTTNEPMFLPLQPPPGGLIRLRQQIEKREPSSWAGPRWLRLAAAAGSTVAAALVLLWLTAGTSAQQQETRRLTRALQAAVAPAPGNIRVRNGAALALPSAQANVRIYLVQTAPR